MAGPLRFFRHTKTPPELVRVCRDDLLNLLNRGPAGSATAAGPARDTALAKSSKHLGQLKAMMLGDGTNEPNEELAQQAVVEASRGELLRLICLSLQLLEFEARKDGALVFSAILRHYNGGGPASSRRAYIKENKDLVQILGDGYNDSEVCLTKLSFGSMLRECMRIEELAMEVLHSPVLDTLFQHIEDPMFEVSSDAWVTFKELVTKRHKEAVAAYLEGNYDRFFGMYARLLVSENYVVKRQSLKLLAEVLLDPPNKPVMLRFISLTDNLKLMMNLLRSSSRAIQFEAFHVFKVFVANPNKAPAVREILYNNRRKLVAYLEDFHSDKDDNAEFLEEKEVVLRAVRALDEGEVGGGGGQAGTEG